jgi:hypothetical protein
LRLSQWALRLPPPLQQVPVLLDLVFLLVTEIVLLGCIQSTHFLKFNFFPLEELSNFRYSVLRMINRCRLVALRNPEMIWLGFVR